MQDTGEAELTLLADELRAVARTIRGFSPVEWEGPAARVLQQVLADIVAEVLTAAALAEP